MLPLLRFDRLFVLSLLFTHRLGMYFLECLCRRQMLCADIFKRSLRLLSG